MLYKSFYEQYVKISPGGSGDMIPCHCPNKQGHKNGDSTGHGSAAFNPFTGVFVCHVCGSFTAYGFLVNILHFDITSANSVISSFNDENGLVIDLGDKDNLVTKYRYNPSLEKFYLPLTLDENNMVIESYIISRRLEKEVLYKRKIRLATESDYPKESKWKRESIVFPYYLGGKIVGIRLRDIYGNKSAISGSYFAPMGLESMSRSYSTLVMLEGETDLLSLESELLRSEMTLDSNLTSVPRSDYRKDWNREFSFIEKLILIPQSDNASEKLVVNAKKYFHGDVEILEIPWEPGQIGKDLNEFFAQSSKTKTVEFLNELKDISSTTGSTGFYSGIDFFSKPTSELEQDNYILSNLMEPGEIVIIGGPQKSMKTFLVLELVRSIMANESLCGISQFTGTGKVGSCLIIEEEGRLSKFKNRVEHILGTGEIDFSRLTFWHKVGLKLDKKLWIEKLCKEIKDKSHSLLVIDPFQRVHNKDENNSTEMSHVWDNIHYISRKFPDLTIVILHHFNKTGKASDKWNSFRGSSRSAGEADLGIFVEKIETQTYKGCKINFDGRSLEDIEYSHNTCFKLRLDTEKLRLTLVTKKDDLGKIPKEEQVMNYLLGIETKSAPRKEISEIFKVSEKTLDRWCEKENSPFRKIERTVKRLQVFIELVQEKIPE